MSIQFRNSRLNRSYLVRVAAAHAPGKDGDTPEVEAPQPPAPQVRTGHHGHADGQRRPAAAPRPAQRIDRGASELEVCHPDIVHAISLLWGYPEMNAYFDRLWMADDSHGPLDPGAMSELMVLSRVHQILVPQRPGRNLASLYGSNRLFEQPSPSSDPWSDVPPRR
jgi:hypothetical protein